MRSLIVAECAAQVGDRARQGGVGDEPPLPDGIDDLVLRHDAAAGGCEERQQIHYLRLQVAECAGLADAIEARLRQPAAHLEFLA